MKFHPQKYGKKARADHDNNRENMLDVDNCCEHGVRIMSFQRSIIKQRQSANNDNIGFV